jgi:6-phosphogluconolactonase (cycloisomerase 2 family)
MMMLAHRPLAAAALLAAAVALPAPAAARPSCGQQVDRAAGTLALARLGAATKACLQGPSGICYLVRSRPVRAKALKRCNAGGATARFGGRCVSRTAACAPGTVATADDVAGCLTCSVPVEVDCAMAALFAPGNLPPGCGEPATAPAATPAPAAAPARRKKRKGPNAEQCLRAISRELPRMAGLALRQALAGRQPTAALRTAKLSKPCGGRIPDTLGYLGCTGALGCPASDNVSRAGFEACANCLVRAAAVAVAARTRPGLCGNGTVDGPGERCETDAVCTPPLHCGPSSTRIEQCTCFDPCGDGIVEPYEQCDPEAAPTGCDAQSSCLASGPRPCTCVTYPRFAFVANRDDDTLSSYLVDAATGALRPHGWVQAGDAPEGLALDAGGRFAWVANSGANTVSAFTIDPAGRLGLVGTVPAGLGAAGVVVHPQAPYAYVPNPGAGTVSAYGFAPQTGALTALAGSPFAAGTGPAALAVDPGGRFLWVADPAAGAVVRLGLDAAGAPGAPAPAASGGTPAALAAHPNGRALYVADQAAAAVVAYAVDPTTGALAPLGSAPAGTMPAALALEPGGRFLYVAASGSSSVSAYALDPASGALTAAAAPVAAPAGAAAVAVDPSGAFAYASGRSAHEVAVYAIDATSGALVRSDTVRARLGPGAIAVTKGSAPATPVPAFVHVANHGSADVSAFRVNPATGALTVGARSPAGTMPAAAAAHPSGRFIYVANEGAGTVSAYGVNATTGTLGTLGTVPGGAGPAGLALDPGGLFAFVANVAGVKSFTVAADGTLAPLETQAAGSAPAALTVDPTGRFLYVANAGDDTVSAYVVNAATGLLTPMPPPVAAGAAPRALAAHPSGRFLYVANADGGTISAFGIDPVNGLLAPLGPIVAAGTSPRTLAVDPSGRFAYAGNPGSIDSSTPGSNDISVYAVDAATGRLLLLDTIAVGAKPTALAVDPSGRFVWVASATFDDVLAFTIGPTGTLTAGGTIAGGIDPAALVVVGTIP